MAILDFNPADAQKKTEIPSGVYEFRVERIEANRKFGTGRIGAVVHFVAFTPNRMIKLWENMFYTDASLWRWEELCKSVGVPWEAPIDTDNIVGKSGRAFFGREKGDKFLKIAEYIPLERAPKSEPAPAKPPSVAEEDVPF